MTTTDASGLQVDVGPPASGRTLAILTAIALAALIGGWWAHRQGAPTAVWLALYLTAYAAGGYSGAKNSVAALRERHLNVDTLMLLAAAGAAAIGSFLEGGVLLFLFSLSETLQRYALGRTETAIRALMDLRPDEATLKDGRRVPADSLRRGDVVVVRPGERFPADGTVVAGTTEVDQSPITGESLPVAKKPGQTVFAATINGPGAVDVRVDKTAGESTVARIIALVAEARGARAPTQRLIDQFGDRYAWGVILGSLLVLVVTTTLLGWPFREGFYRAMALLVVASPCALVISTPASYLAAIANGARHGILLKGGAHLEAAAQITVVAMDKTGTITTGRPVLTDVVPLDGLGETELLSLVAAVERHSEHLIARAVVAEAEARAVAVPAATGLRALPGLGVRAHVNGNLITVASPRLHRQNGSLSGSARAAVARLEAEGKTIMVVTHGRGPDAIGVMAVADEIRSEAVQTVAAIRRLGVDPVAMVTGDNRSVALAVAAEVGIDSANVHADLMPVDKVRIVESLAGLGPVAFVGDGVNDAPAMASASLGIAMGGHGTDAALETADAVLMNDRLFSLVHLLGLGRQARRVVKQNVVFSVGVIGVMVFATLGWGIPLPLGVVAHEGSTVIVVLNGLRLLAWRPA